MPSRHAEGHWFESSIAHVTTQVKYKRQKERALTKALFFIRLYQMKKIILFTIFLSIVFAQDGRYERINNFTRFDTRTGETEYLSDGKWITSSELEKRRIKNEEKTKKLQAKELESFGWENKSSVDGTMRIRCKETRFDDVGISVNLKNNSSWTIDEFDVKITAYSDSLKTKVEADQVLTFYLHSNSEGVPGEDKSYAYSENYPYIQKKICENDYSWEWYYYNVRGFDPKDPPTLNWWE